MRVWHTREEEPLDARDALVVVDDGGQAAEEAVVGLLKGRLEQHSLLLHRHRHLHRSTLYEALLDVLSAVVVPSLGGTDKVSDSERERENSCVSMSMILHLILLEHRLPLHNASHLCSKILDLMD